MKNTRTSSLYQKRSNEYSNNKLSQQNSLQLKQQSSKQKNLKLNHSDKRKSKQSGKQEQTDNQINDQQQSFLWIYQFKHSVTNFFNSCCGDKNANETGEMTMQSGNAFKKLRQNKYETETAKKKKSIDQIATRESSLNEEQKNTTMKYQNRQIAKNYQSKGSIKQRVYNKEDKYKQRERVTKEQRQIEDRKDDQTAYVEFQQGKNKNANIRPNYPKQSIYYQNIQQQQQMRLQTDDENFDYIDEAKRLSKISLHKNKNQKKQQSITKNNKTEKGNKNIKALSNITKSLKPQYKKPQQIHQQQHKSQILFKNKQAAPFTIDQYPQYSQQKVNNFGSRQQFIQPQKFNCSYNDYQISQKSNYSYDYQQININYFDDPTITSKFKKGGFFSSSQSSQSKLLKSQGSIQQNQNIISAPNIINQDISAFIQGCNQPFNQRQNYPHNQPLNIYQPSRSAMAPTPKKKIKNKTCSCKIINCQEDKNGKPCGCRLANSKCSNKCMCKCFQLQRKSKQNNIQRFSSQKPNKSVFTSKSSESSRKSMEFESFHYPAQN